MSQLARAKDQTNRYLEEHLQQGQINMQAHTGALQQLATSTYQRNFDHILPAFLYMMEVIGKNFFHGLNVWKQHASIVEGTSRQKL